MRQFLADGVTTLLFEAQIVCLSIPPNKEWSDIAFVHIFHDFHIDMFWNCVAKIPPFFAAQNPEWNRREARNAPLFCQSQVVTGPGKQAACWTNVAPRRRKSVF